MRALKSGAALRREFNAADRIPYVAHVRGDVVRTEFGDYVQTFRLAGVSFETSDDGVLNNWHERLNVLWRNIAAPGLALWIHVLRRRASVESPEVDRDTGRPAGGSSGSLFGDRLHERYWGRVRGESLRQNDIYLSVVHRPVTGMASSALSRVIARARSTSGREELEDALDACDKLAQVLSVSLRRYEPERLGSYCHGKTWCSSLLEFLALLINGEWQRMPLAPRPLSRVLASSRLLFGAETIEYRMPTDTRAGAMLGIKEYPSPTRVGMYGRLLSAPLSFVLTQSFTFMSKASGQALLQRQYNRMENAGDFAVTQAADLRGALDSLTGNEFVMGEHHFSLQVLADLDAAHLPDPPSVRLRALNDQIALARGILADTGMLVAREDLALEAAFWAQLPGNFPMRPRKAPITSRNLAAMSPFHNFPAGRAEGNHWGRALAVLVSRARSPYYFSLHASDPRDPEGGSRKDTGHTLICGPTGSGKTVFIGFLIAALARRGVTQVVFDKDRGLEILVRALGGDYFSLTTGAATGFNPLQLPASAANVEFMKTWLIELSRAGSRASSHRGPGHRAPGNRASGDRAFSPRESSDLELALRGTLALERAERRLSRLVEFLDPTDPDGLHASLSPWCHCSRGDYAWVFDNPVDTLAGRLSARAVIGFDVTEFLVHAVLRTPITLYLFHLVRQLLDGRRMVCWMDEFWRLLEDPAFEDFAKDGPKTWRKLNGVMCLATQSASDVLDSPIARTLIEQTPTKVFFPNADADRREYRDGFGLTEREYRLVKDQLEPGSRMFLVKQGHHSVVCQLDLKGFDSELRVISGRADELPTMQACMSASGSEPAQWLPQFMEKTSCGGNAK